MPSIFLSHNSADKPFTRRVAHRLHKSGVRVWLDEAELRVGDSLIAKLSSAIDEMDFVGAVISNTSVGSQWVEEELRLAMTKEIKTRRVVVLPLLIDDVALPLYLKDKKYADFRNAHSFEESFYHLLVALGTAPPIDYSSRWLTVTKSRSSRSPVQDFGTGIDRFPIRMSSRLDLCGRTDLRHGIDTLYRRGMIFRVLIFWREIGLTQADALHLLADLSEDGILANILQHSNASPPDAIFIAKGTPTGVISRVLQGLPYTPSYIFPFSYTSHECGARSDYSISVGLRSDFHDSRKEPSLTARPLPEGDFVALAAPDTPPEESQSILERLAS